ncbi:MAG: TonB-dependent receptor [Saprospiraceae bacterium]|uniref:TonB-dependent receptor n=1 Tax=Candidatus Brachybacter algidus TaxID=2982024 RepID=UPI00257F57ED|nr:carboxypeptidase regulatory-like domain-containing protein [Candidatus Brachybacter algidus]MBK7604120.1 TonB-dependent receptor [Candidatus Brachybacter algidus]
MSRIILLFAFLFSVIAVSEAQTSLSGKILDKESGEVVIGATVRLLKDNVETDGTITDAYGIFFFSNVTPGIYNVNITYTGYASSTLSGVQVNNGKANKMSNIQISGESTLLDEAVIYAYKNPLIEQDNTTQGTTITSEQIAKAPVKSIAGLAAASGGVSSANGGDISIRGSRTASTNYYIDGIRVNGGYLPPSEIEQLQIITGGLESQYGDVTGGIIVATTKGPSGKFNLYVDGETSKFLDVYERSEINVSTSGPILKDKNNKSIIGFRLGGRFLNNKDDNAPFDPVAYMNEDQIKFLEANPVRDIGVGGKYSAGEFDLSKNTSLSKFSKNEQRRDIDLNGKLDFRISSAIDVQLGVGYSDIENHFAPSSNEQNYNYTSRQWAFANYLNNPIESTNRLRGNIRLRHKLSDAKSGNKGLLQNVAYVFIAGYEKEKKGRNDLRHGDNFFDYGYIGKFNSKLSDPILGDFVDPTTGEQVSQKFRLEEAFLGTITNGTQNPALANYNNALTEADILSENFVTTNGQFSESTLFNEIFGLYNNVGRTYNTFRKDEKDTYTGRLDINFDIVPGGLDKGRHSVNLGFLYEQNTQRRYDFKPRNIWTLADNLSNNHLKELDYNSPKDSIIIDGQIFQTYNYKVSELTGNKFYKSVRERLGIPLNEPLFINNLTPDQLSLDMFAPGELVNAGLVSFYGYDYLGNKVNNASFNDFFTKTTGSEAGVRSMLIAPFKPIYQSFYLQDKFQARDVIFRLGLRIERYDANTKVLKDPYSLYEISSAQEYYDQVGKSRPDNIDPNAYVYLNTAGNDASGVKAFRVGDTWYNSQGVQTLNPDDIFQQGIVNPRYKLEPNEVNKPDIQLATYDPNRSFKDYDPQVSFSPRIAISFPISEDANFFGHYDVLVERPTNNYASGLNYLLWETQTEFNNPDLKPSKNIDYEIGFQQKLSNSSALKLSIYYKEIRDQIQNALINYTNNVSGSLLSFRNIDFSTVKGLQLQYDLRRTSNLTLQANYTLQFADGTGSDPQTQRSIARNGQIRVLSPLDFDERHAIKFTLDYRFDEGKLYNGPEWFGLDFFSNTGINIITTAVSGRPYTKAATPTERGGSGTIGTYNGQRYPWNFNADLRIDKSFTLNKDSKDHPLAFNIYLRITNVLNTRNIFGLYKASGSEFDDGFLPTTLGQNLYSAIESNEIGTGFGRTSQDYVNAYNWLMYNPDFFNGPRRIYLGASFNF